MPQISPFSWLNVFFLVFFMYVVLNILLWSSFIVYFDKSDFMKMKSKMDIYYMMI